MLAGEKAAGWRPEIRAAKGFILFEPIGNLVDNDLVTLSSYDPPGVLLPHACGLLDIINSNVPPSSNWLCEIMGLCIPSPLIDSECMYGFEGAPFEIISRFVPFDIGNRTSTRSKNGLKISMLDMKSTQNARAYVPTTYNPDTGFTG